MGESLALSAIPGLMSASPEEFIAGMLRAALMGYKVYMTAGAVEKLKPYLDELGIEVREVSGEIREDNYILIVLEGIKIRAVIREGDKEYVRVFQTNAFIKALESFIEKRRGAKEGVRLYELIISKELRDYLLRERRPRGEE